MKKMVLGALLMVSMGTWVLAQSSEKSTLSAPTFTAKQAEAGATTFGASCSGCHGKELQGGFGPALKGDKFLAKWSADGKTVADLYQKLLTMPKGKPGSLSADQYENILAHILDQNGFKPRELKKEDLKQYTLAKPDKADK